MKTKVAVKYEDLRIGDTLISFEMEGHGVLVEREVSPRPLPEPIGSVIAYRENIDHTSGGTHYLQRFLSIHEKVEEDKWLNGESGWSDSAGLLSDIKNNSLTGDWFPVTLNEDI